MFINKVTELHIADRALAESLPIQMNEVLTRYLIGGHVTGIYCESGSALTDFRLELGADSAGAEKMRSPHST
jgi:hypothetical protein